jgi:hypothetical protein
VRSSEYLSMSPLCNTFQWNVYFQIIPGVRCSSAPKNNTFYPFILSVTGFIVFTMKMAVRGFSKSWRVSTRVHDVVYRKPQYLYHLQNLASEARNEMVIADVCFLGNVIEVNIPSVTEKNSFDLARFQASAEVQLRPSLFWDCTILYRRVFRDSLSLSSSRTIQSVRNRTESPLQLTDRLSRSIGYEPSSEVLLTGPSKKLGLYLCLSLSSGCHLYAFIL